MSYLIFQEGDHCLCFERIFLSDESFNNVPGSNMIFYTSVIQVYEYLYCISLFWINIYSMDNFSRNIINFNQYLSLSVLINFCKRLLNFEIKKKKKTLFDKFVYGRQYRDKTSYFFSKYDIASFNTRWTTANYVEQIKTCDDKK